MLKDISPSDRSIKDFKTYKQFTFTNTDSGSGVFGLQGVSGSFHNFLTGSAASQSFGVFNQDSQSLNKHWSTWYSMGTFYKLPLYYQIRNSYYQYDNMMVNINAPLFSWVIENIMKNAADAMDGNGLLNISISKNLKDIVIQIKDNGKGIPSSFQKTIFEPGYTTKERGWGLGLSLSKRIVEGHHDGKIYVKSSKKGVGTTMELILPSVS